MSIRVLRSYYGGKSIRIGMKLKPRKTDETSEQGFEKTFIADKNPEALSTREAILDMLGKDKG